MGRRKVSWPMGWEILAVRGIGSGGKGCRGVAVGGKGVKGEVGGTA